MARKHRGNGIHTENIELADAPTSSFSIPEFHVPLRATLDLATFIPSVFLQLLSVAYCLFVLPGRPASLASPSVLLDNLISNTVPTFIKINAGLVLVQLYFGEQAKNWAEAAFDGHANNVQTSGSTGQLKEDIKTSQLKKINALVEIISSTLLIAVINFCIIILLGAPISRKIAETALLSLFISLLAFMPSLCVLGSPFVMGPRTTLTRYNWTRLFSAFELNSDLDVALVVPAYGTMLGSFIGAVPIPLDWEQPWQTWPVTVILGSFFGWLSGQLVTIGVCGLMWVSRRKGFQIAKKPTVNVVDHPGTGKY